MKNAWFSLYLLVLALWVGGIAVFTFIVTPVIFKSYARDMAGDIVGKLFPGYFAYLLVLSALALLVLLAGNRSLLAWRVSFFLVAAALFVNVFMMFKLHPAIVKVKQEIVSLDRDAPASITRDSFRKLHAASAALNLFLFVDGVGLLVSSSLLKR
ncbi:MAG: hypothetical protein A2010_07135 [Nitrospirae bacterium GWD2_57_9]|nr:MAG: hypothetical protein A2010_07135 [Nitrospirae bacterium GWD2_57_9]